jgi:hypothetical protein
MLFPTSRTNGVIERLEHLEQPFRSQQCQMNSHSGLDLGHLSCSQPPYEPNDAGFVKSADLVGLNLGILGKIPAALR